MFRGASRLLGVAAVRGSVVAPRAVAATGSASSAPRLASARAAAAASTWHRSAIEVDIPGAKTASAEEAVVNITFVNYAGDRTSLPGRVGDNLYEVARRYKYEFLDAGCGGGGSPPEHLHEEGQWFEPKYGEGASCYFCHVIIPKSHYHLLPAKRPDELEQLTLYPFPEDMTDTSRLACQVTLTKEMEGMLVYIPDGPPSDLP